MSQCLNRACKAAKIVIKIEKDGTFNVVEGVNWLAEVIEEEIRSFGSLNIVVNSDKNAQLTIKPNTEVKYPIYINWQQVEDKQDFTLSLGRHSRMHLVESYACDKMTRCRVFLNLDEGAGLLHYRLFLERAEAENNLVLSMARDAHCQSFYLIEGLTEQQKAYDVDIKLQGEGAESELYGAYLTENQDNIKLRTLTEHFVSHTYSDEIFRGIINDSSKVCFDGRILIVQAAQQIKGNLSNNNLLLSDNAHIDTKPELEIYADDVQCSHGATVAQLNDLSLHYLKTRGIDDDTAKGMISFSFIAEVLAKMPPSPCHDAFKEKIAEYLGRDLGGEYDI